MGARPFRPMPAGFAEHAMDTMADLQKRYTAGYKAIHRWRRELGIIVPRHRNGWMTGKQERMRPPPGSKRVQRLKNGGSHSRFVTQLVDADISLAGRAADHLRRRGYIPVCKLVTIDHKADPNIWIVGARKLESGNMIDLAEARGFDPNAWARLCHVA